MGGEGVWGAGRKPRLRLCDAPPSRCRAVDAACPGRVRRRCQRRFPYGLDAETELEPYLQERADYTGRRPGIGANGGSAGRLRPSASAKPALLSIRGFRVNSRGRLFSGTCLRAPPFGVIGPSEDSPWTSD